MTPGSLTRREVECLHWIALGKTTDETATILNRSPKTVRFHVENAARKLGAVNRTNSIARACALGLIDPIAAFATQIRR